MILLRITTLVWRKASSSNVPLTLVVVIPFAVQLLIVLFSIKISLNVVTFLVLSMACSTTPLSFLASGSLAVYVAKLIPPVLWVVLAPENSLLLLGFSPGSLSQETLECHLILLEQQDKYHLVH